MKENPQPSQWKITMLTSEFWSFLIKVEFSHKWKTKRHYFHKWNIVPESARESIYRNHVQE